MADAIDPRNTNDVIANWMQQAKGITEQTLPEYNRLLGEAGKTSEEKNAAIDREAAARNASAAETNRMRGETEDRQVRAREALAPEDVMLRMSAAVREANTVLQDQLAVVQKKQSVGLLDNPIAFLMNTLQLPEEQTKLAQAGQTVDVLTEQRNKLANSVTTEAKMLDATNRTVSAAKTAADADTVLALADQKKKDAQLQLLQLNMNGLLQTQQLDMNTRMAVDRANNAFMQGEQFKMAKDRMAMDMKLHNAQLAKLREAAAQDKMDDSVSASVMGIVNEHAAATGDKTIPQFTSLSEFKAYMKLKDLGVADKINAHYVLGSATRNSGNLMFGADPLSAAEQVLQGGWQVPDGMLDTAKRVKAAVMSRSQQPDFAGMDKQQQATVVHAEAMRALQTIPVVTPEVAVTAEVGARVQLSKFPLFSAIEWDTNPAVHNSTTEFQKATSAAVRAGKLSLEDAAQGLQYFSSRQAEVTNANSNVLGFGAPAPRVVIAQDSAGNSYDLTTPTGAYGYLLKTTRPSPVLDTFRNVTSATYVPPARRAGSGSFFDAPVPAARNTKGEE